MCARDHAYTVSCIVECLCVVDFIVLVSCDQSLAIQCCELLFFSVDAFLRVNAHFSFENNNKKLESHLKFRPYQSGNFVLYLHVS